MLWKYEQLKQLALPPLYTNFFPEIKNRTEKRRPPDEGDTLSNKRIVVAINMSTYLVNQTEIREERRVWFRRKQSENVWSFVLLREKLKDKTNIHTVFSGVFYVFIRNRSHRFHIITPTILKTCNVRWHAFQSVVTFTTQSAVTVSGERKPSTARATCSSIRFVSWAPCEFFYSCDVETWRFWNVVSAHARLSHSKHFHCTYGRKRTKTTLFLLHSVSTARPYSPGTWRIHSRVTAMTI